ncbi:WD40-repeat-containing domain protein [Paraphysoderma sedebokerense]|nr:WD40-repeat-containing domain protein [Paraphysoderma sedebokerense]
MADPIRVEDASTVGGYRYAGRRLVNAYLHQCLTLDTRISAFDIFVPGRTLATCCGKLIHIWDLDRLTVTTTLGKTSGHRGNIRACHFDKTGQFLSTAGEDGLVFVWNLTKKRADRVFKGQKGAVYHVKFSASGDRVLSSSDDGRVVAFDCASGKMSSTNIRHSNPVRGFAFSYSNESKLFTGCADGSITIWDTKKMIVVDKILPDPECKESNSLKGWHDGSAYHTGSILSVSISPNSLLLATTSTDYTCKIWNVTSYLKEENSDTTVNREPRFDRINILDENITAVDGEIHLDERDIISGYHTDLLWTLRHECIVVCANFTAKSDMVITGSTDCTCRIWSAIKGNLLFQINMPSPVTGVLIDTDDFFYISCENRLLVLNVEALTEDKNFDFWRKELEQFEAPSTDEGVVENQNQHGSMARTTADRVEAEEKKVEAEAEHFSINEIRTLLSHGSLHPTSLDTLLEHYADLDLESLKENMTRHRLEPGQLLRTIINADFHPKDILTVLSSKPSVHVPAATKEGETVSTQGATLASGRRPNVNDIYELIKQGDSVKDIMLHAGYTPLATTDGVAESKVFPLRFGDFRPFRSLETDRQFFLLHWY